MFVSAPHLKDCRVAIAGAGDYDFCKAAIQYTEPVFAPIKGQGEPSLANLQDAISDAITQVYTDHIYPNPQGALHPYLMAAIWRRGEGLRLIKTYETAVIRVDSYEVLGSGGELAEYILKRMYSEEMSSVDRLKPAISRRFKTHHF